MGGTSQGGGDRRQAGLKGRRGRKTGLSTYIFYWYYTDRRYMSVLVQCKVSVYPSTLYWPFFYFHLQGDQLYMGVCFWSFVKDELSSVRVFSSLHCTLQATFYKVSEKYGHVYLVRL